MRREEVRCNQQQAEGGFAYLAIMLKPRARNPGPATTALRVLGPTACPLRVDLSPPFTPFKGLGALRDPLVSSMVASTRLRIAGEARRKPADTHTRVSAGSLWVMRSNRSCDSNASLGASQVCSMYRAMFRDRGLVRKLNRSKKNRKCQMSR